jgi:hypothetical protein
MLNWFQDYLTNRTQRVVMDGVASDWTLVTSGVPQGSILGKLCVTWRIGVLAIIFLSTNPNARWCQLLERNVLSRLRSITRKKRPVTFAYHLNQFLIVNVDQEKDLGVLISKNLSWDSHIHRITAKGNRMLGLLTRTCPLLMNVMVRRTLYLAHVKSQLCYASEVWSPHHCSQRIKLEQVQKDVPPDGSLEWRWETLLTETD